MEALPIVLSAVGGVMFGWYMPPLNTRAGIVSLLGFALALIAQRI